MRKHMCLLFFFFLFCKTEWLPFTWRGQGLGGPVLWSPISNTALVISFAQGCWGTLPFALCPALCLQPPWEMGVCFFWGECCCSYGCIQLQFGAVVVRWLTWVDFIDWTLQAPHLLWYWYLLIGIGLTLYGCFVLYLVRLFFFFTKPYIVKTLCRSKY